MSKKLDRLNNLITILKTKNGASVKELSNILGVSEMTIRRDLKILNGNNIANKVYGATIYNPNNNIEKLESGYNIESECIKHEKEKILIGRAAASLINSNDVIIIDTGTTTVQLAESINPELKITALIYSTNILNTLSNKKNISLIFAGGYYHSNTNMFESAEGISLISRTRASKVFISAAGIHDTLGVTCSNSYEILTKQAAMNSSVEKILLADSQKFGVVKSSYFADLADFNTIITDKNISHEWVNIIKSRNIKLIIAEDL